MSKKNLIEHVDETSLCIQRKKRGRGFMFFDQKGNKIKDKKQLSRLRKLVIPPMWKEVMICNFEDGHIQAIGRDAKGRKQYIYHDSWERKRQEEKFARMLQFGAKLPKLRKKAHQDLQQTTWTKNKVLALMVEILDESGIRIGNEQYVKSNQTYGLSTLRRKHLQLQDGILTFQFKGKSQKEREVSISDKFLIKHIKQVAELPGYELFRYKGEDGKMCDIDSHDVNEYIAHVIGEQFSSKDFRTWVGSRLAIALFPEAIQVKKAEKRKKLDNILIRMVADELGNTPTVCRGYYVHPMILQKMEANEIPLKNPYKPSNSPFGMDPSEKLLIKLLQK
jgi:DNA topoisomerase I